MGRHVYILVTMWGQIIFCTPNLKSSVGIPRMQLWRHVDGGG